MATVQRIDGTMVEHVRLTEVKQVGDEGSRSATAHLDGQTLHVYNSIIDGFNNIWYEQVSTLIIEEGCYLVDGQKLEPGMTIRRYDDVAGMWFEGEVCTTSSYSQEKQQRVSWLSLRVEGYVPSPLQAGQAVEIVGKADPLQDAPHSPESDNYGVFDDQL